MPDLLDLTEDFEVLDYQESVRFGVSGTTDWISLDTAVSFPISEREAAASGGAYTQFLCRWDIPDESLGGIEPKVADTVTDSRARVWTVQGISYSDKNEAWNLDCVNLNLAAALSDTLSVFSPINTQDAALGRVPLPVPKYVAIAARFQETASDTRDERGRRINVVRYQVFCKSPVHVNHEDFIVDGAGRIYEFLGKESADRLDLLTVLNLERKSG